MTERDAFGNPIVTGPVPVPVPDPVPVDAPQPEPEPQPGPEPPPRPPRQVLGLTRLLGAVIGLGALAVGAVLVAHELGDATDRVSRGLSDLTRSTATATAPAAEAPRGIARPSLVSAAPLRAALAKAQALSGTGRLRILRVAPARIDAQFTRSGGGLDIVQVRWDGGGTSHVRTDAGGALPGRLSAGLDVTAPRRLVRSAAERLGRSTNAIDYLVALDAGGVRTWTAYFTGGGIVQGDAHGRVTRRIT